MFVLVRKVVEEIERKMLLKFGSYCRSPESAAGGAATVKGIFRVLDV